MAGMNFQTRSGTKAYTET
ncbi:MULTISPECIES: hypothetical protein [Hungatella]|nr:hypothetical protein [Hungatella sp.]